MLEKLRSLTTRQHQGEVSRGHPEISLEKEWQRQAENLARLFANKLKIKTPEEYMATLPKFQPQPENYKGRFDTPVLVETRISIREQCRLAGIDYPLNELNTEDWPDDHQKYQTPSSPYAVWMDEGKRFMNRKVKDVRKELVAEQRGGTEFDGVALYIAKPRVLLKRGLDLPGVSSGSGSAPYLELNMIGCPELDYHWIVVAHPGFGALTCGR